MMIHPSRDHHHRPLLHHGHHEHHHDEPPPYENHHHSHTTTTTTNMTTQRPLSSSSSSPPQHWMDRPSPPPPVPTQATATAPPMIMMERLLYNLHYKCCTYALQTTSRTSRFYAEHTILILAICCFGALLLSHRTFVFYPSSLQYNNNNHNYSNNNNIQSSNYNSNYNHTSSSIHNITGSHSPHTKQNHPHHHRRHYIPTQCLKTIPGFIADTNIIDVTHLILIHDDADDDDEQRDNRRHSYTVIQNRNRNCDNHPRPTTTCDSSSSTSSSNANGECRREKQDPNTATNTNTWTLGTNDRILFSYAREKGYLFLSSSSSTKHTRLPMSIQYVYISPQDSLCFGEPFVQYLIFHLLHYILSPDTVMINWLLGTFYHPTVTTMNTTGTDCSSSSSHTDPHTNHNPTTGTTTSRGNTDIRQLDATTHHSGYIYNPRTGVVIDMEEYKQQQIHYGNTNYYTFYNSQSSHGRNNDKNKYHWWIKRKVYELGLKLLIVIKTSFLFFITTTLVSFTLRETQGRMLQFTHTLQQQCVNQTTTSMTGSSSPTTTTTRDQSPHDHNNVRHHPTTSPIRRNDYHHDTNNNNDHNAVQQQQQQLDYNVIVQLIMTHVLENVIFVPIIVGFIYFLINFYNGDKFLAFMVLTLVWVCESFSMVSLRTRQGMQYFPLFFYFLFALFHYYHISFPYGFSYAALTTSMCFMMHSMLFFWHRYELPAVFLGRVNLDHFRAGAGIHNNTPIPSPPMARVLPFNDSQNALDETMGWPETSSSVASSPHPAPLPNFERLHVGRTHSFTTFASGRLSRNSSNNAMYNRGDEDDEGSYMYFMGGEVVIPRHHGDQSNNNSEHSRQRATSPYNTTSEYVPAPTNPALRVESAASSLSLSSDAAAAGSLANSESSRSRRERFVNELEPVVASAISMDDDSELQQTHDISPDSVSQASSHPPVNLLGDPRTGEDPYVGENNSSALQAILSALDDIDSSSSTHSQNRNDVIEGVSLTRDPSIFR